MIHLCYFVYICRSKVNYATSNGETNETISEFITDILAGEFCYLQTHDGKIVSTHYSPTDDNEGLNIKRGIAGTFQANFDYKVETEESDSGSMHISHYK